MTTTFISILISVLFAGLIHTAHAQLDSATADSLVRGAPDLFATSLRSND